MTFFDKRLRILHQFLHTYRPIIHSYLR